MKTVFCVQIRIERLCQKKLIFGLHESFSITPFIVIGKRTFIWFSLIVLDRHKAVNYDKDPR